jgi:hypothetical protein
MADPNLHRLMNTLLLYQRGQLSLKKKLSGRSRSNLAGLVEIFAEDGFLDELLNDWNRYLTLECELEEAFFGKRKAGVGSYAKRFRKTHQGFEKRFLFRELYEFEKNPRNFQEASLKERLGKLIEMKTKDLWTGEVTRPWGDLSDAGGITDLETLMREYRFWKKRKKKALQKKKSQQN